ncbi:protein DBF4 homolog A [Menidia menidia]
MKMKPRRTQKLSRSSWQGESVTTDEKTTASQNKRPSLVSSSAQVRPIARKVGPFAGKVFFLDLPSNRTAETLESDIKDLGGTVEKFFSKEIKYLVSNKQEARYANYLRQDSPAPSPDSGPSSPHPRSNPHHAGNHRDNIKSKSRGQGDTFVSSRGRSLVERVVKEQGRIQMDRILSNAVEWGVKILYLNDVLAYVQRKKNTCISQVSATAAASSVKAVSVTKKGFQKCKGGRISKHFVKVEDSSRHYRPIYVTMPNMPEFNLHSVAPCSPFCAEDKDPPGNKQLVHRGGKLPTSEERAHGRKKNRDKKQKQGGYCECCMVKYEKLKMHLQSERHKAFSKTDEYAVVDRLVSTLHCDFINIQTKVHRPKCSVSSVLVAPGPCEITDLRHKEDCGHSVKAERHLTAHGFYSGQNITYNNIGSASGSDPLVQTKEDRRTFHTYPDRSKHRSLVRKRTCRRNCLTSRSQTAEQAQIPRVKSEVPPSRGGFPPLSHSPPPPFKLAEQKPGKDTGSSASHSVSTNTCIKDGARDTSVITNEHGDINQDALEFEAFQERSVFSEKVTGDDLAEKEKGSPPMQGFSPVRTIQRRIRVYKQKRRKMEPTEVHIKPRDVPDSSILKLWELFQSSDDVDMEFCGFSA